MHKDWIKLIEKYSYIDKIKKCGQKYGIYYTVKGKQLCKKVSLRVTKTILIKKINEIRTEVGVTIYGKSKTRIYSF